MLTTYLQYSYGTKDFMNYHKINYKVFALISMICWIQIMILKAAGTIAYNQK